MFQWRILKGDIKSEDNEVTNQKEAEEKMAADSIEKLREALAQADAVVIGAGAGLSTSAGFTYSGARFEQYFSDFSSRYDFQDMYSGGFYPYETLEEHWAYWSRYIYVNRYMDAPKPVYQNLYNLVKDKDYFVLTTNVDHCFQKAGFDKHRIFYTQGDYGLFQCSKPCHVETYDNEALVKQMVQSQGYEICDGKLIKPEGVKIKMTIPSDLVPHCPKCGRPMTMNLRADNTFVEDEGWHRAAERYEMFLRRHQNLKVLFTELGVGYNTPVIIKFVHQDETRKNKLATYACINLYQAFGPDDIKDRSIYIPMDCGDVIASLLMSKNRS